MMHDEFVGAFAERGWLVPHTCLGEAESFGFSMSGGLLLVNG
jgi:hypothetical protein